MAKKPSRGKGRGRGNLKVTTGNGSASVSIPGCDVDRVSHDHDHEPEIVEDFVADMSHIDVIAFSEVGIPIDPLEAGPSVIAVESNVSDFVDGDIIPVGDLEDQYEEIEDERVYDDNHKDELGVNPAPSANADWRNLFQSNQSLGKLEYVARRKLGAKVVVSPPVQAVEEGIDIWKASLVGQFLDKPLPFFLVKKSVAQMWKQYGQVEVFSLENGMFIFRFPDEFTCNEVMEAKIWHVVNKPLILRKWIPGMQVLKLTLKSIPIWIKLMHLPLEYWTHTCLSHVASGVGKPLYVDSVTEEQKQLGYARVLVEIDVESECPKEIEICKTNGDLITIGVEYPWLPPKCSLCGGFGHAIYACSKKETKKWVPENIGKGANMKQRFEAAQKVEPKPQSRVQNDVGSKRTLGSGRSPNKVEKVIRRPSIATNAKSKGNRVKLSNSFANIGLEDTEEEEFTLRTPSTFLEVFEKALSSKERGKMKVGEIDVRGFSPTKLP
jgi:hypothetical protein